MRSTLTLTIPQPCNESWAAMTPTVGGRHCAACQTEVVDFTAMSDAEILTYLARVRAAGSRSCGRFAAGQLERPLQRAALAAPKRWRSWLAAAVAIWGLREVSGLDAKAQAPTEQRELPTNSPLNYSAKPDYEGKTLAQALVLRGRIVDAQTKEGLPGVSIFIKGTKIGTASAMDGSFRLECPIPMDNPNQAVCLQYLGYGYRELAPTLAQWGGKEMRLEMQEQVMGEMRWQTPWPWRPRLLYQWSKYWLLKPFRA
jgi:hypothetical protein